jgi:tRNA G18 (ribose-2'-O)-methylase SpoU
MGLASNPDYNKDFEPELDTRNLTNEFKGKSNDYIKHELSKRAFNYFVAIENYQHDFNIGTIVRNANAFNCKGVHIIGKKQWNKRGAMVTDRYLQIYHHQTLADFKQWAIAHGTTIIGIDNIKGSVNLCKTKLPKKCVLVFGQEGPGLSPEMQAICQKIVAIEQFGSTRSINVGVASGIILYNWVITNSLSKNQIS